MTRDTNRLNAWVLVSVLFLAFVIIPASAATTISAPSFNLTNGSVITFPLHVGGLSNVTGILATLQFNASVIHIDSVVKNTSVFSTAASAITNINNMSGQADIATINTDEYNNVPPAPFIDITLHSTGMQGYSLLFFSQAEYSLTNFSNLSFDSLVHGRIDIRNLMIPVTAFTANITTGNVPLAVQFSDLSANTPTAWNWSFGDGNLSFIQNPVHTYSIPGTYTVTLNATNADGSNSSVRAGYITAALPANHLPVVTTVSLTSSSPGNHTDGNLTASWTVLDPDGDSITNITNWYRNGAAVALVNMPFEATNGTEATVAQDYSGGGGNGTVSSGVIFNSSGGHDGFGAYDFPGIYGQNIGIPYRAVLKNNRAFTVSAWVYRRPGSGNKVIAMNGNTYLSNFILYASQGANEAALGYDSGSGWIQTPTTVFPDNTWTFVAGKYNGTGLTLYIDGINQGSTNCSGKVPLLDSNGITIGSWYAGDGAYDGLLDDFMYYNYSLSDDQIAALYLDKKALIVSRDLAEGDIWKVVVTPNDRHLNGAANASNTLTINPLVHASFTVNATYGLAPLTVHFIDLSTGSPVSWNWSFGDGSFCLLQNPVHTYTTWGNYTVSLIAGNAGGTNTTVVPDQIRVGIRPTASFTWAPPEPEVNQSVVFDGSPSTDPDGVITGYAWDFGDGFTDTNATASHVFSAPRAYNISLTVIDNDNSTGMTTRQVSVFAKIVTMSTTVNGTTSETVGGVQSLLVNATTVQNVGGNVTTTNTSVVLNNASEFWQKVEVHAGSVNATVPGNITVDNVTEVVMQSVPVTAALNATLGNVSVALDIALRQWLEDANIGLKVLEGANTTTTHGFQLAATNLSGNQTVDNVAYTVEVSNTHLINENLTQSEGRGSTAAIITMSVSHTWVHWNLSATNEEARGMVKIIRINESGISSVLTTRFVRYDSVTNLDWFEADSPDGLSIFGLVTLHAQAAAAPAPSSPSSSSPATGGSVSGGNTGTGGYSSYSSFANTANLQESDEGKTLTNNVVTTGSAGSLTIPIGTTVRGKDGKPLSTVSVVMTPAVNVPAVPSGAVYSFAGYAVTCTPDGATFSPAVSLKFSLTADEWNALMTKADSKTGHLTVKFYDAESGSWGSVPTTVDPAAHTVTGSVSHFSTYGLFIDTMAATQVVIEPTPASTPEPGTGTPGVKMPVSAMYTDIGMVAWLLGIVQANPVLAVIVITVVGGIVYFGIWKRRIKF